MKKVMMVMLGCGLMLGFATVGQAAFTTLSMYHFDGTGSQQLVDSGPAHHNATKYNTPDTVAGVSGNAFEFVPLSDNSDCESLYADWNYDLNQGFEISLWFKALKSDQTNPYPRILELPGRFVLSIINDPSYVEFKPIGPGGPPILNSSAGYNDGNWHHVVVRYDGVTKKISMYIDDNKEDSDNFGSATFNVNPPSGTGNDKLWFASQNAFASKVRGLKGDLDEVEIKGIAVPEPATIGLLTMGAFGLIRKK